MDELVVAALQERRIDRDHRLHAGDREPRGKRDRVLLGDADVEVAIGKFLREAHQAGAFAHRRRDRDETLIGGRHVAQPVAENLRVRRTRPRARRRLRFHQAHARIELARTVIGDRIFLGELVALPLARDDVQELRSLEALQVRERVDEDIEVVAVDGAGVVEAEFLEERRGREHALGVLLEAFGELLHRRWREAEHFFRGASRRRVETPGHQLREVVVERPDVLRDRHVVVVEDDDHVRSCLLGVVERLERHAAGERAVADHRDDALIEPEALGRHRHAERGRDRRGRVRRAERVVDALLAPRESGDAVLLAQPRHLFAAPGEDLVAVGLVADVPDDLVLGRAEHVMQGDGELDRAEVRGEVPAGGRHRMQDEGAQFFGEPGEVAAIEAAQIRGVGDRLEQGIGGHGRGHSSAPDAR